MKHILFSLLVILLAGLVVGCGGAQSELDAPVIQSSPAHAVYQSVVTVVTPSPTKMQTPTVDLIQTSIAGTVAASYNSTSVAGTSTQEVKATQDFWLDITFAVGTQDKAETQVANTQAAGTKAAETQTAMPLTASAIEVTKQVQQTELQSQKTGMWILNVGLPCVGIAFLAVLIFGVWKWIKAWGETKEAENQALIADTLKPDEAGRTRLVKSSELGKGEKLINPNVSVEDVIDPNKESELTTEQKLSNIGNKREADVMISFANSPVLNRIRQNQNRRSEQGKNPYDVRVLKPEVPALTSTMLPALPLPHYKILFNWDGALLPFGADSENTLMQADLTINPHFLIAGRSRSGKTLSSIRPMVACLLAMGWDVIVLGKRVDFMPFETQSNFKLIAGDVRKDANKYINVMQKITAQMDIRDQLLVSKRVNTWWGYGAPSTMVVLDDYSGAIERMSKSDAREFVSEVKSISMDGAKFGLHLMLGLQSVTWENIDTTIRKQMSRIVYSVSASDSRIALDDTIAARLPQQWNFMTRLTDDADIEQGVGFALNDREIEAFLHSRPVGKNESMDWVDAVVSDVTEETEGSEQFSVNSNQPSALSEAYKNATPEQKIRAVYLKALNDKDVSLSLSMLEQVALGYRGGAASRKVKEVLARFENCDVGEVADLVQKKVDEWKREGATTATATTEKIGDFSPEMV